MEAIEIKVSPDMVTRYGQRALAERLERLLAWEDLSFKAQAISKVLTDAGLNWEEIAEEARQKAWDEYKYKIKDKLPPEAFE